MLRFVNLAFTNPAKPQLPAVEVNAVVVDGDFGLVVGPGVVQQLQLEQLDQRPVIQGDGTNGRLMPYVGPLRVTWGTRDAYSGAIHGSGVVVGRWLAEELQLHNAKPDPSKQAVLAAGAALCQESATDMIMMQEMVGVDLCQEICDFARAQEKHVSSIVVGNRSYVDTNVRDVQKVNDISGIRPVMEKLLIDITINHVEPFFGVEMESWEIPQILCYGPGGKYEFHADAERWVGRPGGSAGWVRSMDRDVSLLVYLNNEFTGGSLNFPDHKFKIVPKRGLVVAFPSSGKYRHGAEPTESGERFVLVTWGLVKGSPRINTVAGKNRIWMTGLYR